MVREPPADPARRSSAARKPGSLMLPALRATTSAALADSRLGRAAPAGDRAIGDSRGTTRRRILAKSRNSFIRRRVAIRPAC